MLIRLGQWFELELWLCEMFLIAPLIGQVHISRLGIYWDRPSEIKAARRRFVEQFKEDMDNLSK